MACNCGGNAARGWVYVAPDGKTTKYKTEVEAMAAKIRNGKTGEVKPG